MTGVIFDIKELSLHDGPGCRVTVFFKGCPLRCIWCHNPEGLSSAPQLMVKTAACTNCGCCRRACDHEDCQPFDRCLHACPDGLISRAGSLYTAEQLADLLRKDAAFYAGCEGGVTFSGGEPLMQIDFLAKVSSLLPDMHKAVQTSGYANSEDFQKLLGAVDYVMFDLKLADREAHKKYTGVYNDKILANFARLKESGKPFVVRTPLIPDITDTHENLAALDVLTKGCTWEKLPYNTLAGAKYNMLQMQYPLDFLLRHHRTKMVETFTKL